MDRGGNRHGDRRLVAPGGVAQFRPRNRYVRHGSLFGSARYGVNIEYTSLRGSNGGRFRRNLASSIVLPPFRWLHALQAVTRFSHVWPPPRWRGTMWSRVRSWPCRPQYWQVWRSRAKISRRLSLTLGRGRRTWYWSRITDGAWYSARGVWMIWWSYSMTSAFSPNTSRNARGRLQTFSGS